VYEWNLFAVFELLSEMRENPIEKFREVKPLNNLSFLFPKQKPRSNVRFLF